MDDLIKEFKAKGFSDKDSEELAKHTINLSEICNIPIEQALKQTWVILAIAMADDD